MRTILLAGSSVLAGLAIALPGQVVEQPLVTSTVTAEAHPMTFWPLAPLAATATPLSYGSPPTPSRVPTGPGRHANAPRPESTPPGTSTLSSPFKPSPRSSRESAALSPLSSASASTTICTKIQGQYPVSTLPAFCRPTLFANAPALASPPRPLPTATVTLGANSVPDKASCCAECAAYYNCFAWRFVPAFVGSPSDRLPAGFDPWRHGSCEVAYYTGNATGGADGGKGEEEEEGNELCPNGQLRGVLHGTRNPGRKPWFEGLYYNGWNQGACGDLGLVLFSRGEDPGVGDLSSLCDHRD
ncbi:hypothetical protein F5Y14DRAFT_454459 [Nemania sp. NC0429]|nr:hypothetical protein F5Y14DRAFT_454459 [Nemania sp. NC0429]